ncbi:hypothetical protein RRSWK_05545 [Rhodopirellula sp. SWK7]|nr:hypothetical protein RRSWK_05545 [Rhodopirellula sp. SWK7]
MSSVATRSAEDRYEVSVHTKMEMTATDAMATNMRMTFRNLLL